MKNHEGSFKAYFESIDPQLLGAYKDFCKNNNHVAQFTIQKHRDEVGVWFRHFTLLMSGLCGKINLDSCNGDEVLIEKRFLQMEIIGTAAVSAKSAIELIVEGSYNVAFAAIRHMEESFIRAAYLELDPTNYRSWFSSSPEARENSKYENVKELVDKLKARPQFGLSSSVYESAYEGWRHLSKGAHSSGEGLISRRLVNKNIALGANYNFISFCDALSHGHVAMNHLLRALLFIHPQSDSWHELMRETCKLARQWTQWLLDQGLYSPDQVSKPL